MPITMFDSTDVSQIPKNAAAVAGYTAGRYVTYPKLLRGWPDAHVLSIAVASVFNADVADCEPGDLPNHLIAGWVKRQLARKDVPKGWKPTVYTFAANMRAILSELNRAGIKRSQYRIWSAHFTGRAHICDQRCGFGNWTADATQWTDHALGRNLDQSLCRDDFFGPAARAGDTAEQRKQRVWKAELAKVNKEIPSQKRAIRAEQAHLKALANRKAKLESLVGRKKK